jgi:hypothetical protein
MSGMMVGHLVTCMMQGLEAEESTISFYKNWFAEWVKKDVALVSDLYRKLQPIPEWLKQ